MNNPLSTILVLLFICMNSHAFQLAELQTETAEELLLFFEEEELVIVTKRPIEARYTF